MANQTDATRIGKVHGNGPDNLVVESGGTITVLSGGTLEVQTGATLSLGQSQATEHIAKVALAAVDTAGGVFAWANPEAHSINVTRVDILVSTIAASACSLDVGTAVTAASQDDSFLDGIDVHTATGIFTLVDQAGANGKNRKQVLVGSYVTGSVDSGASAGLVGFAYIHYFVL